MKYIIKLIAFLPIIIIYTTFMFIFIKSECPQILAILWFISTIFVSMIYLFNMNIIERDIRELIRIITH